MQKYNEVSAVFEYWRLMLLVALTCFIREKNNNYFSQKKKKKGKKRRKKGYASPKAMERRLSRFLRKKYYLQSVEIFFSKPAGLDLYCR
jgi:hypothetical protein